MPDVVTALYQKRDRLLRHKKDIQLDAERRIKQVDAEIQDIDHAIRTLNNAVKDYLCPHCNGTGIRRIPDAAGQMEDSTCPKCKGTGVSMGGAHE